MTNRNKKIFWVSFSVTFTIVTGIGAVSASTDGAAFLLAFMSTFSSISAVLLVQDKGF